MKNLSQDECDPSKPEEHFLWALGQIPMGDKVTQPIQPHLARTISKHLHECGFRHHPKLQKKKRLKAGRGQDHALNGVARWVDMDTEPSDTDIEPPDVTQLTPQEREALVEELRKYNFIQDPKPDTGPTALVTSLRELNLQSPNVKRARDIMGGDDG